MREIASHINTIITVLIVFIAIFLTVRLHTSKSVSKNYIALINSLPLIAILLFISSVLAAWFSGNSNHVSIGGLLPWNDANGYFNCANSLLDKWEIGPACQRRPIYSFYLSSLIGISGRDIQIAMLLQAVLLGSVAYLYAKQIAYSLSGIAALVGFSLIFFYASDYSMTTLTANAGLFYGTFGFVFIWVGARKKNIALISLGTFMITLGLNARAGAFFVLPFIVIWAAFFSGLKNKKCVIMISSIIFSILIAFVFNAGLLKSINADQSQSHANFSYSLYGLTAGGKGWTYVYQSEPKIFSEGGSENIVANKIYAASLNNVLNQPQLFIKGYLKGLIHYFENLLHFVRKTPHELSFLRLPFVFFWFVGFISCLKGIRQDSQLALVASMIIGVILSAPFIKDGGFRVYAATIAIDATLVTIGFAALQQMIQHRKIKLLRLHDANLESISRNTILFSIVMLFLIFPGPLLIRQVVALAPIKSEDCSKELKSIVFRPGLESASLRITSDLSEYKLFPLEIPVEEFRKRLLKKGVHLDTELIKLSGNSTLISAYQRTEKSFGQNIVMIWPDSEPIKKSSVMHACVKTNAYEAMSGLARIENIKEIEQ